MTKRHYYIFSFRFSVPPFIRSVDIFSLYSHRMHAYILYNALPVRVKMEDGMSTFLINILIPTIFKWASMD